jgi:hypothetical protein
MKLEKLLAENMLRFGVKNLNNTDVQQILTIMEQAAAAGTEDSRVTALPAYKPVMAWWNKNADKNSMAKRSLSYWTGGDAKGGVGSEVLATKNLLKHLQTLSKNSASLLDKTKINELITYLNTSIAENIYFKARSAGQNIPAMYVIQVLSGLKTDGDPNRTVLQGTNGKKYVDAFNKLDINKIKSYLEQTQFVYANVTVDDKIALLNYFQQKAEQKAATHNKTNQDNPLGKLFKWDMTKAIDEASSITIAPGAGEIQKIESENPPPPVVNTYTFSYPSNTDIPAINNFYLGDDVVAVTEENRQRFIEELQDLLSQIPTDQKIIEITTYVEAATSQVPTSYGTPKNDPMYSRDNNNKLVIDRLSALQTALQEVVNSAVPKGEWSITPKSENKANIGPAWTDTERAAYPLNKRRKTLANGAPNPQFDETILNKYNELYGPYRGAFGQISIKTTSREVIPQPTEPAVKVTAQWYGKITWPFTGNTKEPKPLRGRNKGGKSWAGGDTLGCPVW